MIVKPVKLVKIFFVVISLKKENLGKKWKKGFGPVSAPFLSFLSSVINRRKLAYHTYLIPAKSRSPRDFLQSLVTFSSRFLNWSISCQDLAKSPHLFLIISFRSHHSFENRPNFCKNSTSWAKERLFIREKKKRKQIEVTCLQVTVSFVCSCSWQMFSET